MKYKAMNSMIFYFFPQLTGMLVTCTWRHDIPVQIFSISYSFLAKLRNTMIPVNACKSWMWNVWCFYPILTKL